MKATTITAITLGTVISGMFITSLVFATPADTRNDRRDGQGNFADCNGDGPRHERKGRHGKEDGGVGRHMTAYLDLTADQQAKIDKIRSDNDKTAEKFQSEISGLKDKMRNEWKAEKPNKQAILSLHKKIAELKNKLAEQRIAERLDIIALLSSDQRAEMIAHMDAKRGDRSDRGHGPGRAHREF